MSEPLIQLEHVDLHLGNRVIFHDMNISIEEGEFIAILGPNGAGKSTLLKLLLGFYRPTHGKVTVLGEIPHMGNNDIGYAPQQRNLESDLALRVRDIVSFGLDGDKWGFALPNKERDKKIEKALQEVDMLHLAERPVAKLSGGEQQRLLIAQAILTDPKVLLLDEPLANLDITHGQEVVNVIKDIAQKRKITVLFVTHDVNPLLSIIDKVLYIAHTHSALGKVSEVVTSKKLSELYGSSVEVVEAHKRLFVLGENTI